MSKGGYVSEPLEGLSSRAIEFIRTRSRRVPVDEGLTGDALHEEIMRIYGLRNDAIVGLLDRLQTRYGGLSYQSGFFQSKVIFAPVCEPENSDEELEILYAVETGGPAGASVKVTGEVEIGLDGLGVREFESLDALIECDAMFAVAGSFSVETIEYLTGGSVEEVLRRLMADEALKLRPVSRASGSHTFWLDGNSSMVFVTSCWSGLGLGVSPILRIWANSETEVQRIRLSIEG